MTAVGGYKVFWSFPSSRVSLVGGVGCPTSTRAQGPGPIEGLSQKVVLGKGSSLLPKRSSQTGLFVRDLRIGPRVWVVPSTSVERSGEWQETGGEGQGRRPGPGRRDG